MGGALGEPPSVRMHGVSGSSGTPARLRVGWGVGAAREPNWKAGVGLGGSSLLSSGVYSEGIEKA